MPSCVFCRILARELPSERLYEAESHIVILDIEPVRPGHALVISREHVALLTEAPTALAAEMMATAQRLAPAIVEATGHDGFNLLVNNGRAAQQVVDHLHLHIIPRGHRDGFHFGWRKGRYEDGEMSRIGAAIRQQVG